MKKLRLFLAGALLAGMSAVLLPATASADWGYYPGYGSGIYHSYYPPPYYWDRYPYYWYPYYWYDYYLPYVKPRGRWKTFENEVKRFEKHVDKLKDVADDTRYEDYVKQVDRAADALHDELKYFGVYSTSHLGNLVDNLNYHMRALSREAGSRFQMGTTTSLLGNVNSAWRAAGGSH